jgi:hypothetical protein
MKKLVYKYVTTRQEVIEYYEERNEICVYKNGQDTRKRLTAAKKKKFDAKKNDHEGKCCCWLPHKDDYCGNPIAVALNYRKYCQLHGGADPIYKYC